MLLEENSAVDIVLFTYTFQKPRRKGTESTVKFRNPSPEGKKCTYNRSK